jgi:hypothetical protein
MCSDTKWKQKLAEATDSNNWRNTGRLTHRMLEEAGLVEPTTVEPMEKPAAVCTKEQQQQNRHSQSSSRCVLTGGVVVLGVVLG